MVRANMCFTQVDRRKQVRGAALTDIVNPCRYDLALISGALSEIRDHFDLSEVMEEFIVGAAKIGAFFGTFLGKTCNASASVGQIRDRGGQYWVCSLGVKARCVFPVLEKR